MADLSTPFKIFWLLGIAVSLQCLIIQIFLYALLPSCRKMDQKILTQLTVARLANVIFEYLVLTMSGVDPKVRDAVFALYFQTDAALICWMFIFTKNLYDKVIHVFAVKKISFVLVSVCIWLLTLPFGLLCSLFLHVGNDYFDTYYNVYGIVKFFILFLNLLFFCRIFWVAVTKKPDRDLRGFLRTCVISFILVCITSAQVLITDITSYFGDYKNLLHNVFSVINSYQVLAFTAIFVILSKPSYESMGKTIALRLKGMAV